MRDTVNRSVRTSTLSRRRLLQGTAAISGGAVVTGLTGSAGRWTRPTLAQTGSAEGELISWGFGVEETNPLAFARVNAFKEAYPNVSLEIVPETDDQKILTAAAADTMPDLLWIDRFAVASWASREVLLPLTDLIARDGYDTSNFYESAIDEATYDGALYGIPGGMDVRVLYVNLDALAEAGITDPAALNTGDWAQLTDLAGKLVKREGDRVDRWGFDHKMQADSLYLFGQANGGAFMTEDGQPSFNDPKIVEALDWGVQTYDAQGGFTAYEAVATTWQGDEQFARGQVALTVYENWMMGILARVAPELNFAVLPIRQRNGDGYTSIAGGRCWAIPAGAKNPDAAWEFIKFMHSDETWLLGANAVKTARKEAGQPYIPALTGSKTADQAQIDQVFEPVDPKFDAAVKLFPEILAQSPNRPVAKSPNSKQINDILSNEGVKPALRKEKSAQEALDQANDSAATAEGEGGVP